MSAAGTRFAGRPEEIEAAGRAAGRQADRLRTSSRQQAAGGAQATRVWHGTASVQLASRSGAQVRAARAGANGLEDVRREAFGFAARLRRIQGEAMRAQKERERLRGELVVAVRDHHLLRADPTLGAGIQEEIRQLRRGIQLQDNTLLRLQSELTRERRRFGDRLLGMVPPEMVQWYRESADAKAGLTALYRLHAPGTAVPALVLALRQHRTAVLTGDRAGQQAALRRMAKAQLAIRRAADPRTALERRAGKGAPKAPSGVRHITGQQNIKTFLNSPAGRAARKFLGPAGLADTARGGVQDVIDPGKSGAQGAATRASGVATAAGAVLLLFPPTAVAGGVLVGGALLTKGMMKAWDKRQSIGRNLNRLFALRRDPSLPKPRAAGRMASRYKQQRSPVGRDGGWL